MNDAERIQKHHGGPHQDGSDPKGPYWKRMHRSGFFWVSVFFILLAMAIFILTDGLLFRPRIQTPAPAATPASP
jgi:hypothetical protein